MTPQAPTHSREHARLKIWKGDGKEVQDLPTLEDPDGVVTSEWVPTAEELEAIMRGAPIIVWQWTGGRRLQPQACSVGPVPGGTDV